jgi:hypothetical protein
MQKILAGAFIPLITETGAKRIAKEVIHLMTKILPLKFTMALQ